MSVECPSARTNSMPTGGRGLLRLLRSAVTGLTVVALGIGVVGVSSAADAAPSKGAQSKAAPAKVCKKALSTGTNKVVLLNLPSAGSEGAVFGILQVVALVGCLVVAPIAVETGRASCRERVCESV